MSTPDLRFHLVDVFTAEPFGGNQLAVFPDGRGISDALMQRIARELNFSETTFVLPPEDPANDFRVRIFTPGAEVPMAGHPTVGTALLLAWEGAIPAGTASVICEEGVGPIRVDLESEDGGAPSRAVMRQPLPEFGPAFPDRDAVAAMLGLAPAALDGRGPLQRVSCGLPFFYVPLVDLEAVRSAKLLLDRWEALHPRFGTAFVFVFAMGGETAGATVHCRMFAPSVGIAEDPATGSANGPLGCYLVRHGFVPPGDPAKILSEQGFEIGRRSFLEVEVDGTPEDITGVRVAGRSAYVGSGELRLPASRPSER